tara:strand:- start:688 stop:1026 length:339 start_codon:yes stop_codon:yes gene_type:complete
MTIGITTDIATRAVTKGFTALHTFTHRMTRADAQSIEGFAQTIADNEFGDRAIVKDGWFDRGGERPNRTKDWWYSKPSKVFIGRMMQAIALGYIKRFRVELQHPHYTESMDD